MKKTRVLHIGNIANNAYLNAGILNEKGFDCDVLCCDYYHAMGCPEWEDADFDPTFIDDMNRLNWGKIDLNGFRRPDWYIQGPTILCLKYLAKRNRGKKTSSSLFKYVLDKRNMIPGCSLLGCFYLLFASRNWRVIKKIIPLIMMVRIKQLLTSFCSVIFQALLSWAKLVWRAWIPRFAQRGIVLVVLVLAVLESVILNIIHKCWHAFRRVCDALGSWGPLKRNWRRLKHSVGSWMSSLKEKRTPAGTEAFIQLFARHFPHRKDQLTSDDISPYLSYLKLWKDALLPYDYVIGYGTQGCRPMLVGKHPYLAYEHGTIRGIPFSNSSQGRLCALTYKLSDMTLITNADNDVAAEKLGLEPYTFIPHPINEWKPEVKEYEGLRAELRARLDADFLVFHPSRQHWDKKRDPSWEKGNDIFIHGLARFIRERNLRAGAMFVEWGQMVEKTKQLLEELGIAGRVHWIVPQNNRVMVRYIKACDLLADQFYLGAFGSTMPKALLHETPAMLYLNEERHRWCFPEMPPIINAATPEEVFDGLCRLYEDKKYREDLIRQGKRWYDLYHSNQVIAERFLHVFQQLSPIEGLGDTPEPSGPVAGKETLTA